MHLWRLRISSKRLVECKSFWTNEAPFSASHDSISCFEKGIPPATFRHFGCECRPFNGFMASPVRSDHAVGLHSIIKGGAIP